MTSNDQRVMALDFGSVRTGVAVSDETCTVVRPLDVVEKASSSDGMRTIGDLVQQLAVTRVIVGLPTGLRGDTRQTAQTRSFAGRLRGVLGDVPVELWDERFTSKMADSTRTHTGTTTSRDSLAACHLLESWMEAQSS